jgi:hypothetical protein
MGDSHDRNSKDYQSFEKWINGMSEIEFDAWLRDDATSNQETLALDIREEISEEEVEEFIPSQSSLPSHKRSRFRELLRRAFGL